MMQRFRRMVVIIGLLGWAGAASAQAVPSPVAPYDQLFLRSELRGSAYELAIARLALTLGSSPAVKAYAEMLVKDHESYDAELRALVARKGLKLEADLPPRSKASLDRLARKSGSGFDRAFVVEARRVNGAALRGFRAEASRTTDPDIRKLVDDGVAIDQRHEAAIAGLGRAARRPGDMPVIQPPMGGAMPVIPPPTGGTTPVIPPPR